MSTPAETRFRLTPAQCAGARAMLGWSQKGLADKADISVRALINFEQGKTTPRPETLAALVSCFLTAGVEFTAGKGRIGVTVPAVGRISEA